MESLGVVFSIIVASGLLVLSCFNVHMNAIIQLKCVFFHCFTDLKFSRVIGSVGVADEERIQA